MKLENIDLSKLQLSDLPKFEKCPCELCDDGCFDRSGGEHFPDCQRKGIRKSKVSSQFRCPLSHYKATFQPLTSPSGGPADHRRQPCPPPPDNEIPIAFKNLPMIGMSSTREHFPPPPPESLKRASPVAARATDSILSQRIVPMETQTQYQLEYTEKPVNPVSLRAIEIPSKESNLHLTEPTAALSSQTTARTHFQPWHVSPSHPYAEMPAVVGHVLFPGTDRSFSTSTGSTFKPLPKVPLTKPIARMESRETLPLSGSMDLLTNYRESFVPLKAVSARAAKKEKANEEKVYTRRPMNAISQTSFDFRPYPNHRPCSPAEMEPFVSQITIGNSLTPAVTKSQYRTDYEGIDTSRHHRPPPAALKEQLNPYIGPYQKMETTTVTHRDFQPLDIANLPRIRMVAVPTTLTTKDKQIPMETMSMSRSQYQPYEHVRPKRQYGEPIPDIYIPPLGKFEGSTTTAETYQGRSGSPARAYIPEVRMLAKGGEHDMNTNYRVDYHPHGLSLCAAKAYAIAQKKQKSTQPIATQ